MRRFIVTLLILVAISVVTFYYVSMPRNIATERAVAGVLDLTDADFGGMRHGLYGEWEFYFGELFAPEDFAEGRVSGGSFIDVPSTWADFGYDPQGFATYRLVLRTDEPALMMLIPAIFNSSVVWINGEIVFEAGTIGRTVDEVSVGLRNAFVPFFPVDGQVEIIVQAAGGAGIVMGPDFAGMYYSFQIGEPGVLLRDAMLRRVLIGAFLGMLISMFVYHLILFLHRRKDTAYLAFALFCLFLAARFIFETNGFSSFFWQYGDAEALTYMIMLGLVSASMITFTHIVFKIPVSKTRFVIYAILLSMPAVHVVGAWLFNFGFDFLWLFALVAANIMMIVSAFRSKNLRDENYYHFLYIIAVIIFIIWPFVRIAMGDTLYMPAISANVFLVLSQYFILSVSYADARNAEQRLASENSTLESLSRMKSEYMANMSHETKTPLTVISVYVQLAAKLYEESGLDDAEISESLGRAQQEIMRVSRMNDSTLRLAAMQTGHEQMSEINTSELLKNSTEAYRSIIEKHGNEFIVNIPDGLPVISGNADRLIQVLANLLTNANTHTKNGRITVDALSADDCIKVTVGDNGAGIAPEISDKVFERGVSGSGGTGFGLDICKDTVESHGGRIWLDSEHGSGTSVMFTLPVHSEGVDA